MRFRTIWLKYYTPFYIEVPKIRRRWAGHTRIAIIREYLLWTIFVSEMKGSRLRQAAIILLIKKCHKKKNGSKICLPKNMKIKKIIKRNCYKIKKRWLYCWNFINDMLVGERRLRVATQKALEYSKIKKKQTKYEITKVKQN